jgi:hypothetical protein
MFDITRLHFLTRAVALNVSMIYLDTGTRHKLKLAVG